MYGTSQRVQNIELDPDKAYQDFHTCSGEFSINNELNFLARLAKIYRDREDG